ncbi:MAG TPA: HAMP domain-containing sensor histidine kinase [Nitrososphaeraceae archaeon]|nr:HAMP domain-containing sensor histidine kinase [Nitrososphaeraceae archaeon]
MTIRPLPPSDSHKMVSELLYGVDKSVGRGVYFMSNVKEHMDIYFDHKGPSIVVKIDEYRNGYLDIRKRGGKIRAFTEITKDNINYCKELMKLVDELRHLSGVKGGLAVSETEYMTTMLLEETEPLKQVIFSSVKEVVEQGQYIFDTLWNTAIPAEQKIKEIEEGLAPIRTRLLENQDEIIKEIKRKNNAADKLSICTEFGGMQMSYNYLFDSYKNVVEKSKEKGQGENGQGYGLRWITNIEKDSTSLVKKFLETGIKLKHIKNMPPLSFGVSDKEVAITIEKMEGGKMSQKFLISNESLYVNHFDSLFEELWKNGIDATERIREIEEKVEVEFVDVISSSEKISSILVDLAKSVKNEALCLVPTPMGLARVYKLGVIDHLIKGSKKGATVKIICPINDENSHIVEEISKQAPKIKLMHMYTDAPSGILIADGCKFLQAEVRNSTAEQFSEAVGFGIYSNSKYSVKSVKAFFDLLWNQHTLNEELKIHDKMQNEFINVAAHELRTPIQPILGITETLQSQTKDPKYAELLEVVNRNARRLRRLTEDILDITKIGSQSLDLVHERFDLNDIVAKIVNDTLLSNADASLKDKINTRRIKIEYSPQNIMVYADKGRITQVISNLLSNAIKFTKEGTISIDLETKKANHRNNSNDYALIKVRDTGQGIDPEILPRLFTKFATKSERGGTGLGLFISKSIVEAHGGKIWAENNADGKGATFGFSLPL